jgi:hypothetical protein
MLSLTYQVARARQAELLAQAEEAWASSSAWRARATW